MLLRLLCSKATALFVIVKKYRNVKRFTLFRQEAIQ